METGLCKGATVSHPHFLRVQTLSGSIPESKLDEHVSHPRRPLFPPWDGVAEQGGGSEDAVGRDHLKVKALTPKPQLFSPMLMIISDTSS